MKSRRRVNSTVGYTRTLRDGFRLGAKTYILQTGAAIFWGPIRNLTRTLVGSIDGAEQAQAFFAARPNKLLHASPASELLIESLRVSQLLPGRVNSTVGPL
jgi:hypothetical protein